MPGRDGTGPAGRGNNDLGNKGMNGCRRFGGQGNGMGRRQGTGMHQGQCNGTGRKMNPNCNGTHQQMRGSANKQ